MPECNALLAMEIVAQISDIYVDFRSKNSISRLKIIIVQIWELIYPLRYPPRETIVYNRQR